MEFMIFVDMKRRRNSEKSMKNVKFVKMSFPVQYLLPWLKLMIFGGTIEYVSQLSQFLSEFYSLVYDDMQDDLNQDHDP